MKIFEILSELSRLTVEELQAYIERLSAKIAEVGADANSFVTDDFTAEDLVGEMEQAVAALSAARAELAAKNGDEPEPEAEPADEPADEPEGEAELAAEVARLAQEALDESEPVEPEVEPELVEPVVAAAPPAAPALRRPARARRATPVETPPEVPTVSLTAAAPNLGYEVGEALPSMTEVARMMEKRRGQFGQIPDGTRGEKIPIVRASWSDLYPEDRDLNGKSPFDADALIAAATDPAVIRANFEARRKLGATPEALTASGGLCAPVQPYYQLQMLSVADRPVRASLPSFNADRGGLRYARPASLAAITTGVGYKTADEDAAGGTEAEKTCQVVECPDFEETDVAIIYHCLQFGNLGARTFPERVAQWNALTLAAHARLAESALLDGIYAASTAVTADDLGLGATATLPSQILTAAAGVRSRNRMADDAVLRVMLPMWVLDLLESDMYRTQFQRFDMNRQQFVALLRDGNVEPSFYKDGATGAGQVFGAQGAGSLLSFPAHVDWLMFPEGSFIYLDGGTLELGLVRDSVLNRTNDFQIFGETFENVAFVGIESLRVRTTVCDSGAVSAPVEVTTCGSY